MIVFEHVYMRTHTHALSISQNGICISCDSGKIKLHVLHVLHIPLLPSPFNLPNLARDVPHSPLACDQASTLAYFRIFRKESEIKLRMRGRILCIVCT